MTSEEIRKKHKQLLIKYQFAKENPVPYKTQIEIINSSLIPLVEDKSFQEKKYSFYMTRIWEKDVRLGVFAEEENVNELRNIVSKYTSLLKLNPVDPENPAENNSWDGRTEGAPFTFSEDSPNCDEIFYIKYLEDIARIGIDLHRKNLVNVIRFSVRAKFETLPYGELNPRDFFHDYFKENSVHYCKKSQSDLDEFWGECGFGYQKGGTVGSHFYYNIILGRDFGLRIYPSPVQRKYLIDSITQEMLNLHGF